MLLIWGLRWLRRSHWVFRARPRCLHSADDHARLLVLAVPYAGRVFDFDADMPAVGSGDLAVGQLRDGFLGLGAGEMPMAIGGAD